MSRKEDRAARRRAARQHAGQAVTTPLTKAEVTRPARRPATSAKSGSPRNRRPTLLVAGAIAVLAALLVAALFFAGILGRSPAPSASGSITPSASLSAHAGCPTSQPPVLAAGQTRTVTLNTALGAISIKVEGSLSPIAVGNFVALAACGFYDGTVFERTAVLGDGTPFVIQGGGPAGNPVGGPGYTIADEPVTGTYARGVVAMARSNAPDSVGSQFFIVLDDRDARTLASANTYQIIGQVTSGMDVTDAIFAASHGVELPANPVRVSTATVTNP